MEKKQIYELPPSKRFKLLHSNETTHKDNPKSLPAKKRTTHEENPKSLPVKKRSTHEENPKSLPAKKRITHEENPASIPAKKRTTHEENPKSLPAKKRAELLYNSCTSLCLPHKKRVWAPFNFHVEEEEEIEIKPFKETEPQIKREEERETKPIKEIEREIEQEEEETKPVKEIERENEQEEETKPLKEINEEEVEEETDDGIICAVCQSTDGDPSDPIVFCDGCDLMVHPTCYGNPLIKSIPEGDWFCSVCESKSPKKAKSCVLCPKKGGALKPTTDNKWAHIMCAFLVPEVFFRDSEGRDRIDCSKVPKKRWAKSCYICEKNEGCVIFCAESRCELGFHVSCGLEEGHSIEYREGKGGDIVAGFCGEHTKLWEKQQLTGKFKIVSRDKELKRKART
ncbi:hypothetical protein LUZ60_009589 [Juncus effusus]|nr:hypothetical protein LUZ60_009589 [Juncus effusus]